MELIGSLQNVAHFSAHMQYGDNQDFKSRLQQYFLENHRSSLRVRTLNFIIKIATCILYVVQVIWNDGRPPEHVLHAPLLSPDMDYLLFTNRSPQIWLAQVIAATVSFILTIIIFFVTFKGSLIRVFTYSHFLLELFTGMPLILSIAFPEHRYWNLPIFFNCLLADGVLQDMLHDIHRVSKSSVLSREIVALFSTLICLIFIGACSMEDLQRGGEHHFDLFTSFYFVVATYSTVGYGDVSPDTTLSRLCVIALIVAGICVLPKKIENLTQTWLEKEKSGFDHTKGFSTQSKHIVVTVPVLDANFIGDFLNEFYAHRKHQGYMVVLLAPCELDVGMRNLLRIPLWSDRVLFVRGTALRDEDLDRVNMSNARACFILSARNVQKKKASDQQTILRSWAVKDYAPEVPQYVQVFRTETKMHIEHAQLVICEDEFKYSLLANNCICPGLSTFITLLMHTSQGEEGQKSLEPWHRIYGFHSGNEIYDVTVKDSKFFCDYAGKTFVYTSFHAHRAYGICLIGVKRDERGARIQLNPGHAHVVQSTDRFYYIALTNEESIKDFHKGVQRQSTTAQIANLGSVAMQLPGDLVESKTKRKRRFFKVSRNHTTSDATSTKKKPELERTGSIDAVTGIAISSSDEDEAACGQCPRGQCIGEK